jgi:hypothetical protein
MSVLDNRVTDPWYALSVGIGPISSTLKWLGWKMTNKQYSIALTVTYIPYIVAELPSNLLRTTNQLFV